MSIYGSALDDHAYVRNDYVLLYLLYTKTCAVRRVKIEHSSATRHEHVQRIETINSRS